MNQFAKGSKLIWSTPVARQHGSFYEVTRQSQKTFGVADGTVLVLPNVPPVPLVSV